MDKSQDCGRYVNTVGNHFYSHVFHQVDTFYCTFVFIAFTLVESRHGVVEVSGVFVASFTCHVDIFEFCLSVSYCSQYTFRSDVFTELHSSGKFRSGIPTLDAVSFF